VTWRAGIKNPLSFYLDGEGHRRLMVGRNSMVFTVEDVRKVKARGDRFPSVIILDYMGIRRDGRKV
jgi:hypothetical protein